MKRAVLGCAIALCAVACTKEENPYGPPVFDPRDASAVYDVAAPETAEIGSATLTDGRVVTGVRPALVAYFRDFVTYDPKLGISTQVLTLVRSDGATVQQGCAGKATPDDLAAFLEIATDLATVEALKNPDFCEGTDVVTVNYDGMASLSKVATCDPQLRALTKAGAELVASVCGPRADGGVDGGLDGGGDGSSD
jgi:hypothetical protein